MFVATNLDAEALARLKAGGKVLLLLPGRRVVGGVALGFSTVFWNTAWTHDQPPHTLGIVCDPRHPALAAFPTEGHSDWQWWELVHDGGAMVLDALPAELRPIIQPIDTWFRAHRLGLAFEARVAGGKLLVCSMDLATTSAAATPRVRCGRACWPTWPGTGSIPGSSSTRRRVHAWPGRPSSHGASRCHGLRMPRWRSRAGCRVNEERSMTTVSAPTRYHLGFLWLVCLTAAMGGLLFGYDWVVIGGAKPFYEPFFGIQATRSGRASAMSSALIGCLAGAVVAGP